MVISFTSEKARKFLLENGMVYTMRNDMRRKVGNDWMNKGRLLPKIADVFIEFIRYEFFRDLKEEEVKNSGFSSIEEWKMEYFQLHNYPHPKDQSEGWLYKVTLMKPCPRCDGEGDIPESEFNWLLCPLCKGKKKVKHWVSR
jgi:hypothetical protein